MSRTRASSSSSNADFSKRIQEAEHDSKALLGVLESLKKEKMTVEGMVRGGLGKTINKVVVPEQNHSCDCDGKSQRCIRFVRRLCSASQA